MFDKQQLLKDIGLKIRKLRQEKGLSLLDFSVMAEIEYTNLIRIEKGRINFTIGTLVRVAKALNVPLRELMP